MAWWKNGKQMAEATYCVFEFVQNCGVAKDSEIGKEKERQGNERING